MFDAPIDPTAAERHGASAAGSIALEKHGVPLRAGVTLAVREKGYIRLEAETPDGSVIFAFVANDNYTLTLDFKERKALPAPPQTLVSLGFADLSADMLAELLLARVPCPGQPRVTAQDTVAFAECAGGALTAKYVRRPVGHAGWFLSEVSWTGGERFVRALLRGHTTLGFARRIELESNDGKATIAIDELDANPKLKDELFQLRVPPGFSHP